MEDTLRCDHDLDEARWQAVLRRERLSDGRFLFAVSTTGVYCRPSCPARRPRREHVRFFASPEDAERAGYRPCLRCRPRDVLPPGEDAVRRARRYLEEHPEERVTLAALGTHVGLSPYHLQRLFRRSTGITPRQYAESRRLERLKADLRRGEAVAGAVYAAGYGSSSQAYAQASAHLGMTPGTYRRRGAGLAITYTTAASALGWLLLAATGRGICAVQLGASATELEGALRREFSAAATRRDDVGLRPWVDALLRHLEGLQPQLDLPLDVRATVFQSQVWEALRAIPYGGTRSYSQVARAVGRPAAARAVARACASNPAALVIPCHRVVRGDGSPGGYRWGLARKLDLLAREAGPVTGDKAAPTPLSR